MQRALRGLQPGAEWERLCNYPARPVLPNMSM